MGRRSGLAQRAGQLVGTQRGRTAGGLAAVFAQPVFQAYGLALLFGGLTMLDRELAAASRYPQGYLRLRWQLSSVVIVALILGALLRG